MNDFAGMEELLSDFLLEAGEMLSDVDSKLMDLEKHPNDSNLLNEIFRGFTPSRGARGFSTRASWSHCVILLRTCSTNCATVS